MSEIFDRFKLAAIDLDGTLLGPDHRISEANALAVRRLQSAGTQVVLASGRHFNSMRKYTDALPGMQWVISCQGGEVSDVTRTTVLSRTFMPTAEVGRTLELGRALGFATVAYGVEEVFTDAESDRETDYYTELAGLRPDKVSRSELLAQNIFKVIWMGDPATYEKTSLEDVASPQVQVIRTNERFLEFMPAEASKGSALATLAAHLGIQPAEAVVFGDGDNDVPMFAWAGLSVAMPHGWPLALAQAKLIAPDGPAKTALARAVALVLKGGS